MQMEVQAVPVSLMRRYTVLVLASDNSSRILTWTANHFEGISESTAERPEPFEANASRHHFLCWYPVRLNI